MTDQTKPPMDLSDVSGEPFGARYQMNVRDFCGSDQRGWTKSALDVARDATVEEMMNEQHTMLMAICQHLGIKVGS